MGRQTFGKILILIASIWGGGFGQTEAQALDLSVITNETALYFKIVTVPNMQHKGVSFWTRKSEDLVKKDLEATGYFQIMVPPLPISALLTREGLDSLSARAVAPMGAEGVIGTQFTLEGG